MFSFITPSHIRTYVPALVGSAIAYLLKHDAFTAHYVTSLNTNYPGWRLATETIITAGTISAYYTAARWIGKKSPKLEKALLGAAPVSPTPQV